MGFPYAYGYIDAGARIDEFLDRDSFEERMKKYKRRMKKFLGLAGAVAFLLLLMGCSSMPSFGVKTDYEQLMQTYVDGKDFEMPDTMFTVSWRF